MCLIVDTCEAALVLGAKSGGRYADLHDAIVARGTARLVIGGRLKEEYYAMKRYLPILTELRDAGRLRILPHNEVERATADFAELARCRSNDQHVLAVAQIGGVRLLVSADADLRQDFTDGAVLSPPGYLYSERNHRTLIERHCRGCSAKSLRGTRRTRASIPPAGGAAV